MTERKRASLWSSTPLSLAFPSDSHLASGVDGDQELEKSPQKNHRTILFERRSRAVQPICPISLRGKFPQPWCTTDQNARMGFRHPMSRLHLLSTSTATRPSLHRPSEYCLRRRADGSSQALDGAQATLILDRCCRSQAGSGNVGVRRAYVRKVLPARQARTRVTPPCHITDMSYCQIPLAIR